MTMTTISAVARGLRCALILTAVFVLMAWATLTVPLVAIALAAPPGLVQKCSDPQFRQDHLSECNLQGDPFLLGGGGGAAGGGGILGGILGHIPGLGGLF
jgi:hypothetical protein